MDTKLQQLDDICKQMAEVRDNLATSAKAIQSSISNRQPLTVYEGSSVLSPAAGSPQPNRCDVVVDQELPDKQGQNDDDELELEAFAMAGTTLIDHVMAVDSSGRHRFIGGAGNMVLVEALTDITPTSTPSIAPAISSRAQIQSPIDPVPSIELPWFARNGQWPRVPCLPTAASLPRPPRYVSDLLVSVYFDRINSNFPICFKPDFMRKYTALVSNPSDASSDQGFLSVFFAVCACASGLMPRDPGTSSTFTGLKYYESAFVLNMASTGHGTIEQVQCLALLSLCTAGWNTLAQSWKFAGSAIRAAQDLGLHVSQTSCYC